MSQYRRFSFSCKAFAETFIYQQIRYTINAAQLVYILQYTWHEGLVRSNDKVNATPLTVAPIPCIKML